MKKILYGLLAYCMPLTVWAQTVSVADVEALPGETVNIAISLSEGKANTYTAFSFVLQFPVQGFTTTGDYTIANAWKGVSAVIGDVDEKGHATVALASANEIAEANVEGLVTVSVKVDEGVSTGSYEVTLSDILLEYGLSEKDYPADATFTINVVAAHTLVLDENSTTVPEAAEGVNVLVKRTFKAGEWSSICLPFAMTTAQVKTAFGDDVLLGNFCDTESTYDNDDVTAISISFEPATDIEANHPYIIKVSTPVTEFKVENVDVDPAEDDAFVEVDNGLTGRKRVVYGGFYGTYHAGTTLEEYALFLNSNKFWYSKGLTQMKAFRAYFVMLDVLTAVEEAGSRINLSLKEDTPTDIKEVKRSDDNRLVYDLQGRRVVTPLKKGLYISKDKKLWLNR